MAFTSPTGRGSPPTMAEINIIPLCDVLLVLLIIFMVTAPALSHQIDLDLPAPRPDLPVDPPAPIDLAIDAGGQLYWDGAATSDAGLPLLMEAVAGREGLQPQLRIKASPDAEYAAVTRVLARARNAGLANIGFVRQ